MADARIVRCRASIAGRDILGARSIMFAIKGHFDGKVFVPDEPVNVPTNRPLVLHVELEPTEGTPAGDVWDTLERQVGTVDAPHDWSSEHDHYLYGTPKRHDEEPK
jgi:hypothetical protein